MVPVTLILLPFAGGSRSSYKKFSEGLPASIAINTVELPGRGSRYKEKPLTHLDAMVDDIYDQVSDRLTYPYAIYGHSMGAVLGYLLTRKIIAQQITVPVHLFVTGRGGPSCHFKSHSFYKLPSSHFIERVKLYGGFTSITGNGKWIQIFEPVLRADFQAVENYRYKEEPPFEVPVTAAIGMDDTITTAQAEAWKKETSATFELLQFPGDHFFIFKCLPELIQLIERKLLLTTL
jgi:surfactin synthase thioesterase subunit